MRAPRLQASFLGFAITGVGALLYFFSPEQNSFYPRCPIFRWTHLRCPGCGATRALAALLHGRLNEALHFNALFVFLAPLVLGYFVVTYYRVMRNARWVWPQVSIPVLQCLLAVTAVFTVTRNAYSL
jgi:hypothetical protein